MLAVVVNVAWLVLVLFDDDRSVFEIVGPIAVVLTAPIGIGIAIQGLRSTR